VELVEKGLSQASVFPGFCKTHEKAFESFENSKELGSTEAISLQIYRSICREVVRLNHEIEYFRRLISDYKAYRDRKILNLIEKRISQKSPKHKNIDIQRIGFEHDPVITPAEESIADLESVLNELQNEHLKEIETSLDDNNSPSFDPIALEVDLQIPVALSGMGSFYVSVQGVSRRVLAILGIFPDKKNTIIIMSGKSADTDYLRGYMSRLHNSFDILNMIEQWMIRGTDHWFVKPNVFANKTDEEKKLILQEIMVVSKGIGHELEFSIFDKIRCSLISIFESSGGGGGAMTLTSKYWGVKKPNCGDLCF